MDDQDTRDLREMMRRSVEDVRPQVAHLHQAARDDGRLLLRRRRQNAVVGLTAAAALAVALPLSLRSDFTGVRKERSQASTPALPVAAGGGETTPAVNNPSNVSQPGGRAVVPGLLSAVMGPKNLLPQGAFQTGSISSSGGLVKGKGSVTEWSRILRPGFGAGTLRINERTDAPPLTCPRAFTGVVCRTLLDPKGDTVGMTTSTTYGSLEIRSVVIQLPTGRRHTIAVANTDSQTWGPKTQALDNAPPLTLDELVHIAAEFTNTSVKGY